jgi:hypothetical protein
MMLQGCSRYGGVHKCEQLINAVFAGAKLALPTAGPIDENDDRAPEMISRFLTR